MGEPQQIPIPPPQGKKSNCLLIGCVSVALLFVVFIVGGVIASYFGLSRLAERYTETEPRQLPISEISEEAYEELSGKYDAFMTAAREEEPASIGLTAEEINALVRNHPDFREARGNVYITIEDNVIGGEISWQFPQEFPVIGGRYLNGSATFQLEMVGGRPALYFESIEVAGENLPDEFLGQLRQENLLQDAYRDPQRAQVLNRIESIELANGAMEISTK